MVFGCFCVLRTTLHDLSIRYWKIDTDIVAGAVGVNVGMLSGLGVENKI